MPLPQETFKRVKSVGGIAVMKRLLLFLIMMCMFMISAELKKLDLHQQRLDAVERFHLLRSSEVVLEIPLSGNMSWKDMLGRE